MSAATAREKVPRLWIDPASWLGLLPLLAAWTLAVAQPLLELVAANPTFLVAHRLDRTDLVFIVAALTVAAPLALWALFAGISRLHPRVARWGWGVTICLLFASMPLHVLRDWPGSALGRWALLGGLATLLFVLWTAAIRVRRLIALAAVSALLFPALFFASPAVRDIGAGGAGGAGARVGNPVPIVVLIFDELPTLSLRGLDGAVRADRFPNFARFADMATWYRNATTLAHNTESAVPAIYTGREPTPGERPPTRGSYPESLFPLLEGAMTLNVREWITNLCGDPCQDRRPPPSRRVRVHRVLRDLAAIEVALVFPGAVPSVDTVWTGFWDASPSPASTPGGGDELAPPPSQERDPEAVVIDFLANLDAFPERSLHLLHLRLPHLPWRHLAGGERYHSRENRPHGLFGRHVWFGMEWEVLQGHQRHLLQVGFVDRLLGTILDKLEETGLLDEALVVLTSDHGTAFRRRDHRRAVTHGNLMEIAHVPLMVKLPRQREGRVDDRNAMTLDILPTVADVLSIDLPWTVDGVSLIGPPRDDRAKRIYHGARGEGAKSTFEFETATDEQWRAALVPIARRFPETNLFRVAPDRWERDLLGERASDFAGPAAPARAALLPLPHGAHPAHLEGDLQIGRAMRGAPWLAIAVEGSVEAVTRTYSGEAGRLRFTAMLDPERTDGDRSTVELFWIDRSGAAAVLRPIPLDLGG